MQAILYLVGGYIVFLGSYGYLKFKDSAGMRPSGVHEKWFEWNGVLGNLLSLKGARPWVVVSVMERDC